MDKTKSIGELLIEFGLITRADLEEGLRRQDEFGLRMGETLIKLGKVTRDDIEWILSKQLDIPFVIVEDSNLDSGLVEKFSKEMLLENRILPLYETEDEIAIATDDPLNNKALDQIRDFTGKKLILSSGNGEKIGEILNHFFMSASVPALVSCISGIIDKIRGTSFYRIDFVLQSYSCSINAFGFGILRNVASINETINEKQVIEAFKLLKMQILYDVYKNDQIVLLSVYPLENSIENVGFPAVIGSFGLVLPRETCFADTGMSNISNLIHAADPPGGYVFIATQSRLHASGRTVFTPDSAPADFDSFHVSLPVPERCNGCGGQGCTKCNDLGYCFTRKIEGTYSSGEMKKLFSEGDKWPR